MEMFVGGVLGFLIGYFVIAPIMWELFFKEEW